MCGARIYIHKGQRKIKLFHLASRFRSMNNQLGRVGQSRAVEKLPPSIRFSVCWFYGPWSSVYCPLIWVTPQSAIVLRRGAHMYQIVILIIILILWKFINFTKIQKWIFCYSGKVNDENPLDWLLLEYFCSGKFHLQLWVLEIIRFTRFTGFFLFRISF